ncbi:hypothetical protein [Legionella longbeachae]|uniref:hypothetical protein n=1 Tax=Legionella longbeachae TaxID=450 RepID=UPI00124575F8|nr:hypothetical protein [Legionella longbeachae]QEY49926.1 hypothetical protein FQU71_00955 [Legionella longbeachae]
MNSKKKEKHKKAFISKKSVILMVLTGFWTANVLAGTMGHLSEQATWNWVGTFSVGPVWESAGQAQAFDLTPDIEKTYAANQSANTLFDG